MKELRYLYINSYSPLEADEGSQYLPDALRFLYWDTYPFRSLPKTFQANNLVSLEMSWSKISQLWEKGERKVLNKLRYLNLNYSKLRTLDLGTTPNLETLKLVGCIYFVELHMIDECPKLRFLDLSGSEWRSLNLGMTPHLEHLNLYGCKKFVELYMPVACLELEFLNLSGSKVSNLNLGMTSHLECLDLSSCNDFVDLYMPVECPKLKFLNLSGSKVSSINLGMTPHIEKLYLQDCYDFVELHMPVECPKLKFLYLSGLKLSNLNLEMTPNIEILDLKKCKDFVELHIPIECPKLQYLDLSGSKVRKLNLGHAQNLRRLDLMKCFCLQEIHGPLRCLERLVYLDVVGCPRFKYFKVLRPHEVAYVLSQDTLELSLVDICPLYPSNNFPRFWYKCEYDECGSSRNNKLECVSSSIRSLQHLRKLTLEGSSPEVPKDLCELESLENLTLRMEEIQHLPDRIYVLEHLKYLKLESCLRLEQLPENICRLECLKELHITFCRSIREIPNSICKMKCLKILHLSFCHQLEKLPEELGSLKCLKELDIHGTGISRLPQSIYQLKGLHIHGSREQLQSYGFTSVKELISEFRTFYYVEL